MCPCLTIAQHASAKTIIIKIVAIIILNVTFWLDPIFLRNYVITINMITISHAS